MERLAEERKKGGGREKVLIEREAALFERMHASLSAEIPLRDLELSAEEEKTLAGYGFLTGKPVLLVFNLGDGEETPGIEYPHQRSAQVGLQGKLEMEIAQLPPDEAQVFLEEYGIAEPVLNRVIRHSYDLLGLISFFTVGEDEVRAWTVPDGSTALESAGAIHTDLQKGFIRAEVIPWEDLVALGGLSEARAKGKLRLEGKEYLLQDGEVMHVRFNV
jgi:ribosome-binding ATPase YchF (GTP1/OBG family)